MANPFSKKAPADDKGGPAAPEKPKAQKQPFTLKPSRQTCVILGVMSGAVLAATVGLFIWQNNEIANVEGLVRQKQEEVANANKIAGQLSQVEADYNAMQGQLRYLETSVSPGDYVPTLLKQTERLAKQVDLGVVAIRPMLEPSPEPPADKEARKKFKPWPYDKLHIDMDVSGGYWNVAQLLYRLTSFEKIIAVENVQIVPSSDQGTYTHKVNAKLRLTGFIFKTEEIKAGDGSDPTKTGPAKIDPTKTDPAKPEKKTAEAVKPENTTGGHA